MSTEDKKAIVRRWFEESRRPRRNRLGCLRPDALS